MKLVNWRTFTEVFLSAEWRLSNWEYMLYSAIWCVIYLLLVKGLEYIDTVIPQSFLWLSTWGLAIFWFVCRIFLWIKRCHDLWHSWSWLFWYLCPIFNLIFPFILYFEKWDNSENKYWNKPENMDKKLKTITVFSIIIWRIGVAYLYYTMFSDINSKLSENIQQVNQEIQYEALTQEELIEAFWSDNIDELSNYRIPKDMLENDSDLIELVLWSLSLQTKSDKQQWFDLYPLMDDEQKENLRDILIREKTKLEEIEAKYETEESINMELSDEVISSE